MYNFIDLFDLMKQKHSYQFQNIHIKNYSSYQSHIGKLINNDSYGILFGPNAFNNKSREEYISKKNNPYFNNILCPIK